LKVGLVTLDERFAICRLAADAELPEWLGGSLVSITRTSDELSLVCAEGSVPASVEAERGWRCLKVEGPLDFELTGILAGLSGALAEAEIPVFAVSTYETDYLLVKADRLDAAAAALRGAGHAVAA
jgi:hypothetical protein